MNRDHFELGVLFLLTVILLCLFAFFAEGGEYEEMIGKLVESGRLVVNGKDWSSRAPPGGKETTEEMVRRWIRAYCDASPNLVYDPYYQTCRQIPAGY